MIYSGRKIGPRRKFSSELKKITYSFSQRCFVCISWWTDVFAVGTQLRCDFEMTTKLICGSGPTPAAFTRPRQPSVAWLLPSHPAAACLPFGSQCGTAPHYSIPTPEKIPWAHTSFCFFSPWHKQEAYCIQESFSDSRWVRVACVSTASSLPSLALHAA